MRDQRAGLGANLAALDAEAAINAVWAISMRAGQDGHWSADRDGNIQRCASLDQGIAHAAHGMRTVDVTVRVAPGIIGRTCDRHLQFELLIVRAKDAVVDGPIGADAVARVNLEV